MDLTESQKASSLSHKTWIYDVFLSFRGEDIRKTFVSHLDKALVNRGMNTFKDNRKLELGGFLLDELRSAIQTSRCAVVVLSENYATSSWCLEELRLIMELPKEEIEVVPIFYGVNPSDVRHQRGTFALDEWHQRRDMADKVLGWREALTGIANREGKDSSQFKDDATMIEVIVQIISSRLLTMSPIDFGDLVGMEAHAEVLSPLLDMDFKNDEVRMIGVLGMGGIGKTTIAKYFYEQLKHTFSPHYYFMENVAKLSKDHGLLYLQHQMLSHIFREKNLKLETVEHGRQQLEFRLRHVKVFLVLDNVDDVEQLYALAKQVSWFGPGSRIIITTRDKSLFSSFGLTFVYKVKYLDDDKALQLFQQIAFQQVKPPSVVCQGLLNRVSRLAQGLPLALKSLGTSLRGKSISEWLIALNSFERVPHANLRRILNISYDSLDEPSKTAFRKVADLLNGDPLWRVATLLDRGEDGVEVLAEKSLIDISADGRINVHEFVAQTRRYISTQQQILRRMDEFYPILADKEGTTVIGVELDVSVMHDDFLIEWKHFEPMQNLNFLMIYQHYEGLDSRRHRNLEGNFILPRKLRLLHWDAYPFTTLPSIINPHCLVEVSLCYSKLRTLWSGTLRLLHLRKLDLTGSKDLEELPDLQEAVCLEELILEGCTSLKRIPKSICSLSKLQKIDVSNCDGLKNLRIRIGESNATVFQGRSLPVRSVRMDFLDAEPSVKESQDISLSKLSIKGNLVIEMEVLGGYAEHLCVISEQQIPHQLMMLEQQTESGPFESPPYGFKSLDILRINCNKESGPFECHSFSGFPWLTELNLINLNIKKIPDDVEHMLVLEKLDLSGNDFSCLPATMIHLLKLKHLTLCNCRSLEKLPALYQLETLTLSDCTNLRELVDLSDAERDQGKYGLLELRLDNCNNVESLSDVLSHFTKLTYLDISGHDCETLPTSIKDLSSLVTLCLNYCKKLKSLTELPLSLKYLSAHGCNSLEIASFPMDLAHLDLSHCFSRNQDYSQQSTRLPSGLEVQACFCFQKSKSSAAHNQETGSQSLTPTQHSNSKALKLVASLCSRACLVCCGRRAVATKK